MWAVQVSGFLGKPNDRKRSGYDVRPGFPIAVFSMIKYRGNPQ